MFRGLHQRFDELEHQLGRIDLILTIKDPGGSRAAEAYDGLRRLVVSMSQERLARLADLARIDAALQAGESTEDLKALVQELVGQTGLRRVDDPSAIDFFEVVGTGDQIELLSPAYLDPATERVVRQGRLRATVSAQDPESLDGMGQEVRS